jgi:hypothetical protein
MLYTRENDGLNEEVENPEAIKLPHYCSSSSAATIKVDARGGATHAASRAPGPRDPMDGHGGGREPEARTEDFGR